MSHPREHTHRWLYNQTIMRIKIGGKGSGTQNREDILMRQRQVREQNKNIAAMLGDSNIVLDTPPTGQSVVTQLPSITCAERVAPNLDGVVPNSVPSRQVMHQDKENMTDDDGCDWLHRNDSYQRQPFSRPMTLTQVSGVENTQLGIEPIYGSNEPMHNGRSRVMEPSPEGGQTTPNIMSTIVNPMSKTPCESSRMNNMGNDHEEDAYGIMEPDVNRINDDDCLGDENIVQAGDVDPDEEARIFAQQESTKIETVVTQEDHTIPDSTKILSDEVSSEIVDKITDEEKNCMERKNQKFQRSIRQHPCRLKNQFDYITSLRRKRITWWLHKIITAYIHCIHAKEHLKVRAGGSVFLEDPVISKIIKTGSCLPKDYQDDAPDWVLKRVKTYLEHDMIFILVNIENIHWYVAVINFRKRCIQVLDSLGSAMHRKDLTAMLEGVEKLFKYASHHMELNSDELKELNFTTWQREECIRSKLQTDGSSCGLWMLNFMEYFTGDILSDTPAQIHMTHFRTKLAVILVDSELNDDDIRNRALKDDETIMDPKDCVVLDGPPKIIKTSNSSKDKIFSHSSSISPPSGINPTSSDLMESSEDEGLSQSSVLSPYVKLTNADLIDEICLYINTIDDVSSLETEWVRSSQPYPISLNLRQIKNILKMDEYMDADCFNMAVRILACHENHLFRDIPVHYMDLNFCMMSSGRGRLDFNQLAQLFHSWPNSREYNISECDTDGYDLRKIFFGAYSQVSVQ